MPSILYPFGVPITLAKKGGGRDSNKGKGNGGIGPGGPGGGKGMGNGGGVGGGGKPGGGGSGIPDFTPAGNPVYIFDTADVSGSTLPDSSGNSRDLTLTGTTLTTVDGTTNALQFNGTSDIAKSGSLSTFGQQAIGFSFYTPSDISSISSPSFLLCCTTGGGTEQRHVVNTGAYHGTPSNEVLTVAGREGSGNYHFSYLNSSTLSGITTGWHTLILNYNSGTNDWSFYLDGTEYTPVTVAEAGTDPAEWTLSNQVVIGRDDSTLDGGADGYFLGSMRKIAAYDTALTPTEISDFHTHLNAYIGA
jgi:hypothetical protein